MKDSLSGRNISPELFGNWKFFVPEWTIMVLSSYFKLKLNLLASTIVHFSSGYHISQCTNTVYMFLLNVCARAGIPQLWALLSGCIISYGCYTHPIDFCDGYERDTVLKGAYRENHSFPKFWPPAI